MAKADLSEAQDMTASPAFQNEILNENDAQHLGIGKAEDADMQDQLDRDRRQQRQTKDLKIKLEQTDLELEQEKALAEIYKLKNENMEVFKDPALGGQKDFPEIKVEYIGEGGDKKEAILSIAGVNYQVKEKDVPVDSIEVRSISDTGVILHFSVPQESIKTVYFKPE
jgi:hypothetical protein